MSLKLSITDPTEVKSIKSYFYELNQIMKNGKKSSNYIITNGQCYSMLTDIDNDGLFILTATSSISSSKKTLLKYELPEKIKKLSGSFNGKELFEWYKSYKSIISEFHFYKNYFEIKTTDSSITYTSDILLPSSREFVTLREHIKNINSYTHVSTTELSDEEMERFKSARRPFMLPVDGTNIRINNKFFVISKPNSVHIEKYATDSEILFITIKFVNDLFTTCVSFYILGL